MCTSLLDYAYIGSRVAQRSYGVPNTHFEPTYDNLGRVDIHRTYHPTNGDIVNFDYDYVANENNIDRKTFDHRANDEYNQYTYDDLDRVIDVDYLVNVTPDHEETFVMDTLGNRTGNQTLTDGTVNFTVQSSTNRYTSIGGNAITHDDGGNMTTDKDEYEYFYDYENRLIKIEDSSSVEVATHDYDALGRRIRVIDKSADPDVTTLYYYNPDWQVLAEYNGSNELQRYYVYGNYIDEPLVMHRESDSEDYYYAHDHLYSVVALLEGDGDVIEPYEYDAYGKMTRLKPDFTAWSGTKAGNPYYFTGRRFDFYADGPDPSGYYRNRYYDTQTGRFLQHDPLGINPASRSLNPFVVISEYRDGLNLYARPNVVNSSDAMGLLSYIDPLPYPPGANPPEAPSSTKACCKIKQAIVSVGILPVVKTSCTQKTIDYPTGLTPGRACRCHYEKKSLTHVYGWHPGECCWCRLYYVYFPGLIPPWDKGFPGNLGHRGVGVVCEQNRGSWMADFGSKGAGWPDGAEIKPFNPEDYNTGSRGKVSCDVADKWKQVLEGTGGHYFWPVNDCEDFAKHAIHEMKSDCP